MTNSGMTPLFMNDIYMAGGGGGGRREETERTTEKGVMGVGKDSWGGGGGGGNSGRGRDELFVNGLLDPTVRVFNSSTFSRLVF